VILNLNFEIYIYIIFFWKLHFEPKNSESNFRNEFKDKNEFLRGLKNYKELKEKFQNISSTITIPDETKLIYEPIRPNSIFHFV
jgi:hypothetical protein